MSDDPGEAWPLSEDHLDLYWYFADSRNSRGTPKASPTYAMQDFGYKWAKLRTMMDEIADAGYWRIKRDGYPEFDPGRTPPRPEPLWEPGECPEASASPPQAPTRTYAHPQNYQAKAKELATSSRRPTFGRAYGTVPVPSSGEPFSGAQRLPAHTRRWLARDTNRRAADLVEFFSVRVRSVYFGRAIGSDNLGALARHINRWISEGTEPDLIKQMIQVFVAEPQFLKKGAPAWKSFVYHRQRLQNLAQARQERDRIDGYWKRGRK